MGFGQDYARLGIKEFYQKVGKDYFNPHEGDIKTLVAHLADPTLSYLDLGCGSGVVSEALLESGCSQITGCDPFLSAVYTNKLNLPCLDYSFEEIASGKLTTSFDVIICSYAMHLVPESYLPSLLYQLSTICQKLIILTPHKRPAINHFWQLTNEFTLNKTKLKTYQLNKG